MKPRRPMHWAAQLTAVSIGVMVVVSVLLLELLEDGIAAILRKLK